MDDFKFTGIILCGGHSRRMGADKAMLPLGDKPFLQHLIDLLKPLCNTVLISGDHPDYAQFGLPLIPDEIPDSGAIGGLYSSLKASKTDWNLVLSCDSPIVDLEIIERLKSHVDPNQKIVHAATEAENHPLIGFYHKSCANQFKTIIESGNLKLQQAVNKCDPFRVLFDGVQAKKLFNVNTLKDYKNLLNHYL